MSTGADTGPAHPYIDLQTLQLVMPGGKTVLTGEEWRQVCWPPCPHCGATIGVDQVDVTCYADQLAKYTPGWWACPNECDQGGRTEP